MFSIKTLEKMARHQKRFGLCDRSRKPNLVARVRSTPKGEYLTAKGIPLGAKGGGANTVYEIRQAAYGWQGPIRLYCNCPDQFHRKGFGRACKHIDKLLLEFPDMQAQGLMYTDEIILYDPEAVEEGLKVSFKEAIRLPESDEELFAQCV